MSHHDDDTPTDPLAAGHQREEWTDATEAADRERERQAIEDYDASERRHLRLVILTWAGRVVVVCLAAWELGDLLARLGHAIGLVP